MSTPHESTSCCRFRVCNYAEGLSDAGSSEVGCISIRHTEGFTFALFAPLDNEQVYARYPAYL